MTTLDEINRLSPEDKRALLERMLREKARQDPTAPLSSGQQRLWFLDQLEPNTPLYNIPTALRLTGELSATALAEGLNEIVRRHESLRTTFPSVDGAPHQKINAPSPVPLAAIDLSPIPPEAREAEARRHIGAVARKPFDLSQDLMVRAALLKLSSHEHILVLVAHHIAADEWSLRALFKELAVLYEASRSGGDAAPPALPIQYRDYAAWQRDHLQSDAMAREIAQWREHLQGCNPNLELPSDAPRAARRSHRGGLARRTIPAPLFERVKALARQENATVFMALLAGFNALLHRHTRQEDLLVGSPIAGRTRSEMENLIGFFVNTLVFRTRVEGSMTFRQLLGQVRATTLWAYERQDLPFDKLVEAIHPERGASGSPLVQVMFALNSDFLDEQLFPGLRGELMEVETGTAKFDLTLVAQEERGGLTLKAEYDADLFSAPAVERLLGHFENLLAAVTAEPDAGIGAHDLTGPAERRQLLVDWNDTRRDYPRDRSIPRLVEEIARRTPKATAVAYGNGTLTYQELNAKANQLARLLQKAGLRRGDVVGTLMDRSVELIVALLGVLKAGGAYLPMDASYPQERLAFMMDDAGARFSIAQPEFVGVIPNMSAPTIQIDGNFSAIARESEENLPDAPGPLDVANVIYTSGSTGKPKGVRVPHRGIVRLVCGTDYLEIEPEDAVAQASSISFDAASWEIWAPLLNGARVVGFSKEELVDADLLAEGLRKYGVTAAFFTTALFNQLAAEAPGVFANLKCVIFGGEASDPKSVAAVLQQGPPRQLLHAYGPTETSVYATIHRVTEVPDGASTIPIGRPIANSTAYIVESGGTLAPIGVPGELWLGGDGVALGYLGRPELTAERFVPDRFGPDPSQKLYRSGDLARLREDGAIEFIGRADSQVKLRGFRIELGEIEAALLTHPAVRKAVVLAREDSPGGKRLVAYIECEPEKNPAIPEIKALLKRTLPDFMIPAAFVAMEKMPMLPNGKVDRKGLPAPEWHGSERAFEAAATPLERQISKIWERILGVQPIGVTDNFFDLGGHSLLAVKLFAQLDQSFGRKLPLASLFKAPTIRQLAEIIRADPKPQAWSTIVDIQPRGGKRPIFWVHSLGGDGGGGFFYYRKLAELLGQDQPSFGIRSPQEPFDRIEAMARHYIQAIKEKQPRGPYQLGGFCFGGLVAFEMARQLEAAGEVVGLLAILESGPPNLDKTQVTAGSARFSIENVYENLRDFASHPASEQVAMLRRKAKKIRDRLASRSGQPNQPPPALNEMIDMTKYPKDYVKYAETHWKALENYKAGGYRGTIHLFRARKQPLRSMDPSLGWNQVAPGRVRIAVIPGTHESMVQEPNVQTLAQRIREAIEEAAGAAAG